MFVINMVGLLWFGRARMFNGIRVGIALRDNRAAEPKPARRSSTAARTTLGMLPASARQSWIKDKIEVNRR
jgi:hypothetical protein